MKLFAPSYYKNFKCIADKCRHSCCVDWEISVDGRSLERYRSSDISLKDEILSEISETDDGSIFKMRSDGRCPFLNSDGLCRIIMECGEEYLCDICALHPRFYNYFSSHAEVGLGMVCEEAARIILEGDGELLLECIGEADAAESVSPDMCLSERKEIISILETDLPILEKIKLIEQRYNVSTDVHSFDEWKQLFSELEILDEKWSSLVKKSIEGELTIAEERPFERFISYLTYRHIPRSESYDNLRAVVGFILLSYRMVRAIYCSGEERTPESLTETVRLYSSEIEYCEENVSSLIFEFESVL